MTKDERIAQTKKFLLNVKSANKEFTKKEHFKDLLHRLYSEHKEANDIIDSISAGSEYSILNIPRKDGKHYGSADTLYNRVIIEFENDISTKPKYNHAKEQLAGYLLGQYNSGEGYNYTLIASDFIRWKVLTLDIESISRLDDLNESDLVLHEVKSASIELNYDNLGEFYFWIDRFLFKEEKQKASLRRIEESFGHQSNIFLECFRELNIVFQKAKEHPDVQVSYEQWRKFLSIAYGQFEDSAQTFLIHTYLSVFAKLLAYEVISHDDFIDDQEMEKILSGEIFNRYNISNFVDNDFFHWVHSEKYFKKLKKSFRLITQGISNFDFNDVDEDVLKGVYQELIDIDTRHALGEYYTPDWLCERMLQNINPTENSKFLDPSCGSGSFLRAFIHRIKQELPELNATQINDMVYGIDIHPLSVQIAKTTVLISLGKSIINSRKPVQINVILANTLLAPEGVDTLFGGEFKLNIDKETYYLNTQILDNVRLFDSAIQTCEDLANTTLEVEEIEFNTFGEILKKQTKSLGVNEIIQRGFYTIYKGLRDAKLRGRDSIWKFIIQNVYKPYFLSNKFDFVVGNPPWFTYSSIRNEDYQNILNELSENYQVKPSKIANFPHLEIAAIFLSYCSSYFLKEKGKISFVLPRSFLNADHHENTRSGNAKGFRITDVWDLNNTTPLFRIPSCVIWAEKASSKRKIKASGIDGLSFQGKLSEHNCNLKNASADLIETKINWYYTKSGNSSAFSTKKRRTDKRLNPYKKKFRQGATIVPRALYFIELNQEEPPNYIDRIVNIKTAEYVNAQSKKPWKEINIYGQIESKFLFYTALSNSILPFVFYNPKLIILPVSVKSDLDNKKSILLNTSSSLLSKGYLKTSDWFKKTESIWENRRTEKNEKITATEYLNWQNKLVSQDLNKKYVVLYNASAKDANAVVVNRSNLQLEFINESKCYAYYTNDKNEAFYLIAILNSGHLNILIKDFQTRGLFGPRDVHKKILDIYFPKYDFENLLHLDLVKMSQVISKKCSSFVASKDLSNNLSPHQLGRLRVKVRKEIEKELKVLDKIIRKIIKER